MLARTPYKTAQELGIREIEHEYLSRFVSEGEQGKLPEKHLFAMDAYLGESSFDNPHEYTDLEHRATPWCGTVGCIAGTMDLLARKDGRLSELLPVGWSYGVQRASDALSELFCPVALIGSWKNITLNQAVSCTKHFLQTGKVDWPLALGEMK